MEEFIRNFHFLRPWFLILAVFPLLLYKYWYHKLDAASSWERACDKNLLDYLLIKGSSSQRRIIFYICGTAFLISVIAASGPSWIKEEAQSAMVENPVMFVLNMSSDMEEKDLTPNRLSRAKYAVSDLLKEIKQSQKGLIVYSGEPFLITPVTEDAEIINNILPSVDFDIMPENGDNLFLALKLTEESFSSGGWSRGEIIVLAADVGQNFSKALQQAEQAAGKGYHVNVINASATENDKLAQIAEKGKGLYFNISQTNRLAESLNQIKADQMKLSQNKISQWRDEGYWLVFIPLICCLYLFRRGILGIVLVLSLIHSTAHAGFFLNSNQEGLQAFSQEDYQTAVEKFKQSAWQASSYYRLGAYDKAYQKFSASNDVESLYNQGNALAKMGKIEEAIKKYEEVLEVNPKHEDAKFNLEYLKQQQDDNSQSSSDNNEEDDNQQNQSSQQQNAPQESQNNQDKEEPQNGNSEQDNQSSQDNQPQNQESGEDEDEKKESNSQSQDEASQPREEQNEEQENSGNALQKNNSDNTYNEEIQARELRYREIPEDTGGLLRAFIAKEYAKNRYAKDK